MGAPMAANILAAGHDLIVHDVQPGRARALRAGGSGGGRQPPDVGQRCDTVITCLPGPREVEAVALGEDGVFAGLQRGSAFIDTSTNHPATMRKIAAIGAGRGFGVLDAPVGGGVAGARDGTLTVFVGGEKEVFERRQPLLKSLGRKVVHMGAAGSGNVTKLVNNVMMYINFVGACEGMVMGVGPALTSAAGTVSYAGSLTAGCERVVGAVVAGDAETLETGACASLPSPRSARGGGTQRYRARCSRVLALFLLPTSRLVPPPCDRGAAGGNARVPRMRVVSAGARYREIEVYGTPREMGRQLGEAAGEEIRGFAAIAVERVNKTAPITREQALATASACIPYVADYAPELLAELRGMAASSGVSLDELMLPAGPQSVAQPQRCRPIGRAARRRSATTAAARRWRCAGPRWSPRTGTNDPALDPFTVVLTRRPLIAPATLTVGQAGLIGLHRLQRPRYRRVPERAAGAGPRCGRAALFHRPPRAGGRVAGRRDGGGAKRVPRHTGQPDPGHAAGTGRFRDPDRRPARAAAGGRRRLADAHQPLSASGADRRQRAVSGADRVGPPQAPDRRPSGTGRGRHRRRP